MNHAEIPHAIKPLVRLATPNAIVPIYSGKFTLRNNQTSVELNGSILFKWFPEMRPEFSGHYLPESNDSFASIDSITENKFTELVIDGLVFGKCFVTKAQTDTNSNTISIKGIIPGKALLNDTSVPVSTINFCVANLKNFNGDAVRTDLPDGSRSYSSGRLVFSSAEYTIVLNKIDDFDYSTLLF